MPFYEVAGPTVLEKYLSYQRAAEARGERFEDSLEYWKRCGFMDACRLFYGSFYVGDLIMQGDMAIEEQETTEA